MITPGPFAPTVTQWVAGTPTVDAGNNEVPAFTDRLIRVLAEFPGSSSIGGVGNEVDTAVGDLITADRVLLIDPSTVVSERDQFTASDSLRYRVQGAPSRYVNPMTGTAITQVNLRRIT